MYKKLLVPLDGSEFSARILEHVKVIASGCKVPEVILLMVGPTRRVADVYMSGQAYEEGKDWVGDSIKIKTAFMEYLSQVVADLKQTGIAAETVILWGNPAEEIVNYIENNQVDLVMMSTHGRSGASRWLLGSVTQRVVRHSIAPVFVASPLSSR
jgi:nucleotide-binding universal stress UspA family protein